MESLAKIGMETPITQQCCYFDKQSKVMLRDKRFLVNVEVHSTNQSFASTPDWPQQVTHYQFPKIDTPLVSLVLPQK
jgi:hypothetical protein